MLFFHELQLLPGQAWLLPHSSK
uniref:Uncharacterized protein n=1 Tax=Anguilla anguilla TaxID=7936 RepID=A0A0E9U7Z1_ANGAN